MATKKILALVLAVIMGFTMFACSPAPKATTEEPAVTAPEDTAAPTEEPIAEPKELTMWHIYGEADAMGPAVATVIADAEKEFNVTIKVDTEEAEPYKTKIIAAVSADTAPDIFITWGRSFIRPFIDAGKLLNLSDYMSEDIKNNVISGSFSEFSLDGSVYAFTDANAIGALFCNQEMFDKYGLKIPTTWDELIAVCQAFIDQGITPLAVGAKDTWTLAMYHDIIALRCVGPEKLKTAIDTSDFSDPGFLEAATKLRQLVDMGAFDKGALAFTRDEGEAGFYAGTIPMMQQGSWTAARVYKDTSMVAGKIVSVPFPVINEAVCGAYDLTGGGQTAYAVNAKTSDPELAVVVAEYLAQHISAAKFSAGGGISPYKDAPTETSNELFMNTFKMAQNATSLSIWWDTYLPAAKKTVYLNKLQELFGGMITPEEYIQALNEMTE